MWSRLESAGRQRTMFGWLIASGLHGRGVRRYLSLADNLPHSSDGERVQRGGPSCGVLEVVRGPATAAGVEQLRLTGVGRLGPLAQEGCCRTQSVRMGPSVGSSSSRISQGRLCSPRPFDAAVSSQVPPLGTWAQVFANFEHTASPAPRPHRRPRGDDTVTQPIDVVGVYARSGSTTSTASTGGGSRPPAGCGTRVQDLACDEREHAATCPLGVSVWGSVLERIGVGGGLLPARRGGLGSAAGFRGRGSPSRRKLWARGPLPRPTTSEGMFGPASSRAQQRWGGRAAGYEGKIRMQEGIRRGGSRAVFEVGEWFQVMVWGGGLVLVAGCDSAS
jgi:hypothetical protein